MTRNIFSFLDIPPRVAYLDPSFMINFLLDDATFHKECLAYSKMLKKTTITLIMSNLGFDEIWFALLKILTMRHLLKEGETQLQRKWFRFLKQHPNKTKEFANEIEIITFSIRSIPNLAIIEISDEQTMTALSLMKKYGLMPRDAIHTAATILSGAGAIITTDADFAVVEDIEIYTCNPKCFV